MKHADRVLFYVLTVLAIAIVAAILIVSAVKGAGAGNICERHHMVKQITRGGRSWRCRRVHDAALRFRPRYSSAPIVRASEGPSLASSSPTNASAAVPLVRAVRTIPIANGLTPHERIERAFDKLMIFPIEDEP